METKTLEIRDEGTFIPAIAVMIDLTQVEGRTRALLRRAGYGPRAVLFGRLEGGDWSYDPYGHGPCRTMRVAHEFILEHWDCLDEGSVVCVETILGEREEPKDSELRALDLI